MNCFHDCEQVSAADVLNRSPRELAAVLGCTQAELNTVVRARFGRSVVGLRLELRLLEAARLLRQPGATVASVTEQCGFGNARLFAVCFQKRFAMTPSQWRRRGEKSRMSNSG